MAKPTVLRPPPRKQPPLRQSDDELIAAHIATKGVTRAVDFGIYQQVVDMARSFSWVVMCGRPMTFTGKSKKWLVNGAPRDDVELYVMVNNELRRRAQPEIQMPKAGE